MAEDPRQQPEGPEPRGFGEHARGLAGEYAHEQGWGLNLEQRRRQTKQAQNTDGGNDYDYGAQDFGDEPMNTTLAEPAAPTQNARNSPRTNKQTKSGEEQR
ncbi:MAG TPA: hypothetical protein VHY48_01925 [Acidobacteriaceae bacterium]|jgi:hypothetical protein|nr:hypothetical protein [Acidobacteriaceae bacterium]